MSSSYDSAGGSLKLKGVNDKIKKKKKSKKTLENKIKHISVNKPDLAENNSKQEITDEKSQFETELKFNNYEITSQTSEATTTTSTTSTTSTKQTAQVKVPFKTKAELKYEQVMLKRQEERILKNAELTHKERVEMYNRALDQLSEYNDIPKVSWTK